MEKFDKIIKDKLQSYPTEEKPNDDAVSNMMDLLDQALPLESKTRILNPLADNKKPIHIVYKIAASLTLIVISLYALIAFNEVTVEVGKTAFEKVELPDRSIVHMNADSRIAYNKFLSSKKILAPLVLKIKPVSFILREILAELNADQVMHNLKYLSLFITPPFEPTLDVSELSI